MKTDWEAWEKTKDPMLYHRALFNIDQATTIAPENAEIWFVQGMLYLEMKNTPLALEKALSSFLQAVAVNQDHGRAQLMLAQTLTQVGKFDLAIEQYHFLIQDSNMANSLVLNPLAVCYTAAGRTRDGIVFFKTLSNQYQKISAIRFGLSVLQKQAGHPNDAIKTLRSILDSNLGTKEVQAYAENLLKAWEKEDES